MLQSDRWFNGMDRELVWKWFYSRHLSERPQKFQSESTFLPIVPLHFFPLPRQSGSIIVTVVCLFFSHFVHHKYNKISFRESNIYISFMIFCFHELIEWSRLNQSKDWRAASNKTIVREKNQTKMDLVKLSLRRRIYLPEYNKQQQPN